MSFSCSSKALILKSIQQRLADYSIEETNLSNQFTHHRFEEDDDDDREKKKFSIWTFTDKSLLWIIDQWVEFRDGKYVEEKTDLRYMRAEILLALIRYFHQRTT